MRVASCLLLLAAAVSAQETFAPRFEDGDVWTETTRASLTLKLRITEVSDGVDGATRAQESPVSREERRETTILEARKDGPLAWRTSWPTSRVREGESARPTELEGASVEIRGRDATPADAPDAVKAAARDPGGWRAFLPEGPKSVGDAWTVPAAAVARIVVRGAREEPSDEAALRVTFGGVEEKDGARIATLAIEGGIAVTSRQEFRVLYDLKGALKWDLATGHPVSLELKGEARAFEGKVKDERGEVVGRISGEGSSLDLSVQYVVK